MKIAYLCNIYPRTTHTFIRREIETVENAGIEVERLTLRRSPDELPSPQDKSENTRTFCVVEQGVAGAATSIALAFMTRPIILFRTIFNVLSFGSRSKAGILKHLAYFAEACIVDRHCRRKSVSHLHVHFATNAAMVGLFVRKMGGPTMSFTIHGAAEWDCPEFIHMREKIEIAEFVVAISYFTKAQAYRWIDPDSFGKIHVVRCGVDEEFLSQSVSEVPDSSQLIVIGRFVATKGHVILLDSLQILADEGLRFRVKFIGDGPLRDFLEEQIEDRGLLEHVEICGWMANNEVRDELIHSRAMILPSFGEGLPVVIMEALALGRPVICTNISAISELVVNQKNGWLVNAGNANELADAIREAISSPVERLSEMGRAGREVVEEKHNAVVEANKMVGLFRRYVRHP